MGAMFSGIPFGSVNLQTGVLPEETTVTSTAGGGTLALEFGMLSRLTSDPGQHALALVLEVGVLVCLQRGCRLNVVSAGLSSSSTGLDYSSY